MHNLRIQTVKKVNCNFSADQWELYTHKYERDEIEMVANELNSWIEYYVNAGMDRSSTENNLHQIMRRNSKYGAYDSEPIRFLEHVMAEIYRS